MNKNTLITLVVIILIGVVIWWFSDEERTAKGNWNTPFSGYNPSLFNLGTLNPNLTGNNILIGCNDPLAMNYDSTATQDSGNCIYKYGCCDINASNYDPQADSCDVPNNELLCDWGYGIGYPPNDWDWDGGTIDVQGNTHIQKCWANYEDANPNLSSLEKMINYISMLVASLWCDLSDTNSDCGNWFETNCDWHPAKRSGYVVPTIPPQYLAQMSNVQ